MLKLIFIFLRKEIKLKWKDILDSVLEDERSENENIYKMENTNRKNKVCLHSIFRILS